MSVGEIRAYPPSIPSTVAGTFWYIWEYNCNNISTELNYSSVNKVTLLKGEYDIHMSIVISG